MSQAPDIPGAEFSRLIEVEVLGTEPVERSIEASETERLALARRFGLLSLDRLEARIEVQREAGRRVRAAGRFEAELQQRCVVSLVPVKSRIAARFVTVYSDDPAVEDEPIDWNDDEDIEPYENGTIDLGEGVAQQLAVRIDPYPRAPGAAVPEGYQAIGEAEQAAGSPFDELSSLHKRN
ncbi:MAG: DUF177 domain-containing protein [Rhodospirillaceae bacterium]|nr:DUF177 domain-containing protein [Rhodospirillaceae bacterium]